MDKINGMVMAAGRLEVLGGGSGIFMQVMAGDLRQAKRNFVGQQVVVFLLDEVEAGIASVKAEDAAVAGGVKADGWREVVDGDMPVRGELIVVRERGGLPFDAVLIVESYKLWWKWDGAMVKPSTLAGYFRGTRVLSDGFTEWMKVGCVGVLNGK